MLQEVSIIGRLLRQPRTVLIVGIVVAIMLAIGIGVGVRGCGGEKSKDGTADGSHATTGPTTSPTTQASIAAQADGTPRPVLSLSVNGATECRVYQGWALTASVVVAHPSRFGSSAAAVQFGTAGRPWTESLRLVVTGADGKATQLPLKLMRAEPAGELVLTGDSTGRAMWQISSQDGASVASGSYALRAMLDAGSAGMLESRPVVLHISPEPAQLSAEEDGRKQRMLAVEAIQRQDWTGAAKRIDTILARSPDDISAWELKGDLLVSQKKLREAVGAYDRAVAEFRKIAKDEYDEPSRALIAKRREAMAQMMEEK